jgi:hypothetical protein
MMSFETLHLLNGRASPVNLMKYKHAILLHKIYNKGEPPEDWLALNFKRYYLVVKPILQPSKI